MYHNTTRVVKLIRPTLVLSSLLFFFTALTAQNDPKVSDEPVSATEAISFSDIINPSDSQNCDRCPVQITNMQGKVVSYSRRHQMSIDDMRNLKAGMYIVSVRHKSGRLLNYTIYHRGF